MEKQFAGIIDFYFWLWNEISYWDGTGRRVEQWRVKKYRKYIKQLKKMGWINEEVKDTWVLEKDIKKEMEEVADALRIMEENKIEYIWQPK